MTAQFGTMFDLFRDSLGRPLSDDAKARLWQLAEEPNLETWVKAHSIILQPGLTVWQAWIAVDRTAPGMGPFGSWTRFPTQDEVALIFGYAGETREENND